jgi:PII-like signaling protein
LLVANRSALGAWYFFKKKEKGFGGFLLVLGILPVVLIVVAAAGSDTEPVSIQRDTSAETTTASQVPPTPITVEVVDSVANILELYESNEVGAEASYSGKWAEMKGKIEKIENVSGRIEVNLVGLQDLFGLTTLVCKASKEQTTVAAELRKGDVISVRGKILGVPGVSNVVVEPCEVLKGGTGTQTTTSTTPLQPPPNSQTDITVEIVDTAENILELYQSNEIAADVNYTGKLAEISGKIELIESKDGRIEVGLVGLGDLFGLTTIVCKISVEQTDAAAQLRKGGIIKVRGTIQGVPGVSNIVVEPCELIS